MIAGLAITPLPKPSPEDFEFSAFISITSVSGGLPLVIHMQILEAEAVNDDFKTVLRIVKYFDIVSS
jgi:hypothetical protein